MFVFLWIRWISAETGARSDVPHHMIYPLKHTRPNLHFLTGVHVKHVTFDEYVLISSIFLLPFCMAYTVGIGQQVSHILSTLCCTLMDQGTRVLCKERSSFWSQRAHLVLLVFSSVRELALRMYSSASG